MREMVQIFVVIASFWVGLEPTHAGDWPMFRGSQGLIGVADGQVSEKPTLAWSFKAGGPVKSSAAIVGDRIYVGSDDGNVYALSLISGKKVWEFKTGGPVESSPLVVGGTVFVGSTDAFLYALKAEDGSLVWKYETGDKILGGPNWVKAPDGKSMECLIND